jgi:hypothetical protein
MEPREVKRERERKRKQKKALDKKTGKREKQEGEL